MRCTIKFKGVGYVKYMSFGLMGEPLTKVQRTDSGSVAGSYALAYEYGDADHPTAPSQIGHERYAYDANGNPTLVEDDSLNTERRMAWDEENRLMALSDNGKTSRYTYNAAGERIVKSHGYLEGVYVNGAPQGLTFHETEDYTIYPAPILSVTRQRFTKHYFIGDRRIASKIGAGIFQNAYGHGANVVTAGQKDYQMRMMQIEKQREDYYRKLGTPPGVPTMKGATAEPENTHEGYNTIIRELGDHSVPDGWIQRPKRNAVPGTPPGPPVQWDKAEDPDDVQPGYGYVPADTAHHEDIFYYHTDHLGSTSYITDAKANVAQFDAYLPYGELLVDEHSSTEEMPYKFNGKEFDEETGLYYYGARYMNPRTSLWYGMDPLTEKYPEISSYIYCHNNPVKLMDNDGADDFFNSSGYYVKSSGQTNIIYIVVGGNIVPVTKLNLTSKANRQTVANVVGYYASKIGISYYAKGGHPVGNNPKGTVGLSDYSKPSDVTLAFNQGNDVFINRHNNKISELLSNIYNFMNVLVHENKHKMMGHGNTRITNYQHAEVYFAQISHSSFSKTTSEFKETVLNSMTFYLRNAIVQNGVNDDRVYSLIKETNLKVKKYGYSLSFKRYSSETSGFDINVEKNKS